MIRYVLPALILFTSGSCVAPQNQPPANSQAGTPGVIAPAPPAPPPSIARVPSNDPDWQNWPLQPGQWKLEDTGGASFAGYIGPDNRAIFSIKCDKNSKAISIMKHGNRTSASTLSLATTFGERSLSGNAASDLEGNIIGLSIPARDLLLDQLIFSRGSIGINVQNEAALRIPTSPKLARVVEDCR